MIFVYLYLLIGLIYGIYKFLKLLGKVIEGYTSFIWADFVSYFIIFPIFWPLMLLFNKEIGEF